jgi:hypothetical protein
VQGALGSGFERRARRLSYHGVTTLPVLDLPQRERRPNTSL